MPWQGGTTGRRKLIMKRVITLLVFLVVLAGPGRAVVITDGPNSRPLSLTASEVSWTTDVPSDSRVDYGLDANYGQFVYDPNPTRATSTRQPRPVADDPPRDTDGSIPPMCLRG